MSYRPPTHDLCPLCGKAVLFVRCSKGRLEALEEWPTAEGWIHIEEGLTHVFENHVDAVEGLLANGFRRDQIHLYELHYCDG